MLADADDLRRRPTADLARARATALGSAQGGVVTSRQLRGLGLPWWFLDEQVRAGRWASTGRLTLAVHNAPLTATGEQWRAVLELGPRAALSGTSALRLAGVDVEGDGRLHVLVPKGAGPRRLAGVAVHESRRFCEQDVLTTGLRRTRPAVSAVLGALWARTDREALLLVTLVVQQRRATAQEVASVLERTSRHRRLGPLREAAADLLDGVRSLGELDVARAMRARGLPEPERQALRRRPSGRQYLDADFPAYGIALEVDGAQHGRPDALLADCLRDLDLAAEGRLVARLPLTAWRLDQDGVLDALERLFRSRGWRP